MFSKSVFSAQLVGVKRPRARARLVSLCLCARGCEATQGTSTPGLSVSVCTWVRSDPGHEHAWSLCVCVRLLSCSVMSDSLRPQGLQPARLLCPWNVSGKNAGVGCRFLLQGFFPIQGLIPHLLCENSGSGRQMLHHCNTWKAHSPSGKIKKRADL